MAGLTGGSPLTADSQSWLLFRRDLDKIFKITIDRVNKFSDRMFNPSNKKTKDIREQSWGSLAKAQRWDPNGDAPPSTTIERRFDIYAVMYWVAQSFGITLETMELALRDEAMQAVGDLGNTIAVRKEEDCMGFIEGGLGTYWNDQAAEYLFDTQHKLSPTYAGGGVRVSNLVNGFPSVSVLTEAEQLAIDTPDDRGLKGNFRPVELHVHSRRYPTWLRIVGDSGKATDSANIGAINLAQMGDYKVKVVSNDWITEPTLAFLKCQKHGLVLNQGVGIKSRVKENDALVQNYIAYASYGMYARDWRGYVAIVG